MVVWRERRYNDEAGKAEAKRVGFVAQSWQCAVKTKEAINFLYLKLIVVRHAFTVTTFAHYGIVRELPEPEEQNYRPELRDSVD